MLNRDLPGSVLHPNQLYLLPQAGQAVRQLNEAGYGIIVVTNQACVGRGDVSPTVLDAIHTKLERLIEASGGQITVFYVCPHREEDACECRKPSPGLIQRARADYDFDPSATWLVGDSERDLLAAHAAGCKPALVLSGKENQEAASGVPVFRDLKDFADCVASDTAAPTRAGS